MKYLKRYNEELKYSTYTQAANKLKGLGHVRRASVLSDWAEQKKLEEEKARYKEIYDALSKYGSFELEICKSKYDSASRMSSYSEPFLTGNFLIVTTFENGWFSDMVGDYLGEGREYSLSIPLEMGIMPADDLTLQKFMDLEEEFSREVYDGILWTSRIWIKLFDEKSNVVVSNGPANYEPVENDCVFFVNRREATRYKNLLVTGISGESDYCNWQWSNGLKSDIIKFIEEQTSDTTKWIKERTEKYGVILTKEDLPKIVSSMKTLSINRMYRD